MTPTLHAIMFYGAAAALILLSVAFVIWLLSDRGDFWTNFIDAILFTLCVIGGCALAFIVIAAIVCLIAHA